MAKILISLVGGRPLPNIIAALYFQPEYLYFIVSRDSRRSGGDYEKTIAALPQRLKPESDSTVNPYSLQDTIDHCRTIIQKHKEDEIIINATLGPKTMAFGAYEAAREFKQQGFNIEVCYLAPQGLVWVFREPHEPEPVKIGLKQYFNSYGWNVSCKNHDVTDNFRNLVQFMVDNLPMSFLTTFRNSSQGKGKKTHKCPAKEISDDYYSILCKLEELRFISNVQHDDKNTRWTINSSEDRELLIKGDWLEYYVYKIASALIDGKGNPIFDECGWGVEDNAKKGEIDFAGIFGGQLIIASCKTEESIKKEWFQELSYKTEQLGKGMCSALLISTASKASRKKHDLEDYNRWAEGAQVVLVMQEDLAKLPEILREIREKPRYPRI